MGRLRRRRFHARGCWYGGVPCRRIDDGGRRNTDWPDARVIAAAGGGSAAELVVAVESMHEWFGLTVGNFGAFSAVKSCAVPCALASSRLSGVFYLELM